MAAYKDEQSETWYISFHYYDWTGKNCRKVKRGFKIYAYDEDVKWQLAEPGALMSTKAYRDKKALPFVEKLKEAVKNLTIKCVQLAEQSKKMTAKVDGQQKQISRLTDKEKKVMVWLCAKIVAETEE